MMHLAEYRKRATLLADYLPWAGLVAPGVVLNKDGSFQRTAAFRGPDLDSATESELIATCARLNNALKRLGSGWALFVEAARHPAAAYPQSTFPEGLSWLIDEERRAAFDAIGSHFESSYFLTLFFCRRGKSVHGRGASSSNPRMRPNTSTGASTCPDFSRRPIGS